MKKRFQKMTAVLLSALLLTAIIFAAPITTEAAEIMYDGNTGNCRWELDVNGTLTISGYGAMSDYSGPYNSVHYLYTDMRDLDLTLIKTIIIKFGVTSIGDYSFADCTNLKSVTIPNGVTKIGVDAFKNCTSLTSVTIPNSVVYLWDGCFSGCSSLQSAVIGDSVKYIYNSSFYDCSKLTNLTIGKSVKYIDRYAFAGCASLTTVTVPDSVESIDTYAFSACSGMTELSLGKSVNAIGDYAFANCTSLKTVEMGDSVNYIGEYAFHNCNNLHDVYYSGDKRAWKNIDIREYNSPLTDNVHCGTSTFQNVIVSDYKDNHNFTFNRGEEIEDLVLSQPSDTYNPRLSHFLACMARSAYTQDLVKNNYYELDFKEIRQYNYGNNDPLTPFTIGEKIIDKNNKIVMITIRGSIDLNDFLETNFNLGNDSMIYSHGWHSGFSACAAEVLLQLENYLGSIQKEGVTYVITGHSLGAATGNLLAVKLFEAGVPSSKVYDYNFACPNVAMGSESSAAWNYQGRHNNIINVGNWCDYFTHVPGAGMEFISADNRMNLSSGWSKWKKYGVSYWFDNGWQGFIAHDMGVYLDYIEKEYDASHFAQSEYAEYTIKTASAWCPVDVVIYDKQGNPIAGTINDVPNYYGYEAGEKAYIYVNGDRKLFHILSDDDFEVRLQGTADGEMEFHVTSENMTSGETVSEKQFKSVQLTDKKEMNCVVIDDLPASEAQLFSVDNNKNKILEILDNGTEVNPISISESKLDLAVGAKATLNAESKDEYRWYSTDENVATVKDGVVTVLANGETSIIAETVNGAKAICKISVTALIGDINSDGTVNGADAGLLSRYTSGWKDYESKIKNMAAADINRDGKVNGADSGILARHTSGWKQYGKYFEG